MFTPGSQFFRLPRTFFLSPSLSAGELALVASEGETQLRARQDVPEGLSWGPYRGNVHSEPTSPRPTEAVSIGPRRRESWLVG